MARSAKLAELFEHPTLAVQRQYEVCRAYFLEKCAAATLAERFGMHVGSIQAIVRDFAYDPDPAQFFDQRHPGRKTAPKRDAVLRRACDLRRAGATFAAIRAQLAEEGFELSESYVFRLLQREGVPTPPRRRLPGPGDTAADGSLVPPVADVERLSLKPGRTFRTDAAGLFLFVPLLLELDIAAAVREAQLPGTRAIPPLQAFLALLAPKLLGQRRISHIRDLAMDEGAGLFAGLNVLPKSTYATNYSYMTERRMSERLVAELIAHRPAEDDARGFNVDFHAIPFRGEKPDLENHWVPRRQRGLPSVMAFIAQQAERRIVCYATANVLRDEAEHMVARFADYWKEHTGRFPARLLFDSRATTYAGLEQLNQRQVGFITIRRRGPAMLQRVRRVPQDHWQECQITQAKGKRRQVRYLDERVALEGYTGTVRQLVVEGLGRESPTFFLANDYPQPESARAIIQTYARRNHVENLLGEQITFFHIDCLASQVRLNVDFDLTLTVVADRLYRGLAQRLKGFDHASPLKLFRKFVSGSGTIEVTPDEIVVHMAKHAHNPVLKEGGFGEPTPPVPWLGDRRIRVTLP
jgi:transposase